MKLIHRIALALIALAGTAGTHAGLAKSKEYRPSIDPANFQATVDNPYFPLTPGTTFTFIEKTGEGTFDDIVTVTADTKIIMGVTCIVVHDLVKNKDGVKEETYDWYAQDKAGSVWYFGEDTKEYHANGKFSSDGSWEAGVDGAQPGIIMKGHPVVGESYRQEYRAGQAEDMSQVIALNESIAVPFGKFADCVRTKDWSMLEVGSEAKWYARGVGLIREQVGKKELAELVSVKRP